MRVLPATRLPELRESRRGSGLVSLLLHVLIILLLVVPFASHTADVVERPQGAGGPSPAGGGGGGHRGTGGVHELVHFTRIAQAPTPSVPVAKPVVKPPQPMIPPPPKVKPPEPATVAEAKPEAKVEPPKPAGDVAAPIPGTGGGSGRDGTAGNGPGTGGGVGSGEGTGRGSGTGPGTGGGTQANYAPTPTEMFIPPLPMPDKVRGFHLVAEYDVDSTGKVLGFDFTPTRDGGYNKRLKDVLGSFKFRPGTKPDGTPVRMKAQIIYDF